MTVSTETRKAGPYTANGVTTNFAFAFKVFSSSEVRVVLADADGVESDLALTTNYTVSLNADQSANPGGSITTTGVASPYDDSTITITSTVTRTQGSAFPNAGGWYPAVVEAALDRLTILIQQVALLVTGALRQPISDSATIGELPTATERASSFLAFDADGDPVATTAASLGAVVTTAFTETLLDDTTAAAARTTLGLGTMSTQAASAVAVTGGTVDGAAIGGSTPAAITGTTVTTGGDAAAALQVVPLRNLPGGLAVSQAADTDHDVTIAAGSVPDSTGVYALRLASAMTKQIDATWAAGSAAGGMFTGAVANATWYFIHLIRKTSDGSIDAGFDTSATAANIPSGYVAYRCIGAVLTDGSANIVPFYQRRGWVYRRAQGAELTNGTATSTTAVDLNSSVPSIAEEILLNTRTLVVPTGAAASNTSTFELVSGTTYTQTITQAPNGEGGYNTSELTIPNVGQNINYYNTVGGAAASAHTSIWVLGWSLPAGIGG